MTKKATFKEFEQKIKKLEKKVGAFTAMTLFLLGLGYEKEYRLFSVFLPKR